MFAMVREKKPLDVFSSLTAGIGVDITVSDFGLLMVGVVGNSMNLGNFSMGSSCWSANKGGLDDSNCGDHGVMRIVCNAAGTHFGWFFWRHAVLLGS